MTFVVRQMEHTDSKVELLLIPKWQYTPKVILSVEVAIR